MAIQITGRHVEVSAQDRKYIEKRITRVAKHIDQVDEVSVVISAEKHSHIVEINFRARTIHAFAKGTDSGIRAAFDKSIDKVELQVTRAKDRMTGNRKHAGRRPQADLTEEAS